MKTVSKVFRFQRTELDLARYELRRAGRRLPLSRIPMEFLILLLEERGKLVERERIAARLWPNAGSVDIAQGINAAVKRIRAVLNDDAAKPRFIETVVGKGYRFIAEVEEINLEAALPAAPEQRDVREEPGTISAPVIEQTHGGVEEKTSRAPGIWKLISKIWMGIGLLLVGGGAAAWYIWKAPSAANTGPVFRQVTTLAPENRATGAAISPDGSLTAYANTDGIFIQAKNGETTALPAPADFVVDRLAWFASGTKLVASGFSSLTYIPDIWTISVTGAPPRLLRPHAREGVPSPDGTRVAFISQDRSQIWIMGASGEEPRQIAAGPAQDTFPLVFWSPDGRRLAFQRRHYAPERHPPKLPSAGAEFDIYYERSYESVDLSSGRMVARTPKMWMNSAMALPDGRILFLRWDPPGSDLVQLWEVRTRLATGAFLGTPHRIASPAVHDESFRIYGMSATADGKQILVLGKSDQDAVFVGDFSPSPPRIGNIHRLTLDDREDFPHAWTRDSRQVIFESNRFGNYDIFRQEVGKRTAEPIVATARPEVLPQIASGGRWVLYRTWSPGAKYSDSKLMRVPVEGGTPEEVPIGGPLDEFRCALGQDKRCVLRTTVRDDYYAFFDLDPIRGKGRELARTKWVPEFLADWDISPDGTKIAIPNHSSRDARIRVVDLQGEANHPNGREVLLPGLTDLSSLASAADGRGWFVSVDTTVGNRLLYVWPDGRTRSLEDISGYAVPSPDGRRVAFRNRTIATNAWLIERH